jgi:uncharacterized protein YndB with AHSA1/START domain
MLAQWFGPEGFTNPVCTCDARVGGEIHIIMRANDEIAAAMGFRDASIRGEFKQVDSPRRLVFTDNAVDADDNVVLNASPPSSSRTWVAGRRRRFTPSPAARFRKCP